MRIIALFAMHGNSMTPSHWHYLSELSLYCSKVVCLVSGIQISELPKDRDNIVFFAARNMYLDIGKYVEYIDTKNDDLTDYDRVLLVNDSCDCVQSLGPILNTEPQPRFSNFVIGITDSMEESPHLQSYFLLFERDTIVHLLTFIKGLDLAKTNNNKKNIVMLWEIGLSTFLMEKKVNLKAIYSGMNMFINPSYSGYSLLKHLGCPLIKKYNVDRPHSS